MTINLSKKELELLNKVLGYIQDANDSGSLPEYASDVIDSDKFQELNEKIAEALADA